MRRIVLLFALILGLVAISTSLAPPRPDRDEGAEPAPSVEAPTAGEPATPAERTIRLAAPARAGRARVRRVATGTRLTVLVRVRKPADVEIEGLGLRQTAEPLAPARFDLIAVPAGRYDVMLYPVAGGTRRVARLEFEERARVRLQEAARPGGG